MSSGELIKNATDKYNQIVASKKWTKTYPKDANIIALTTRMYRLEKTQTYVLAKFQRGGDNITYTRKNTEKREPRKSYVERMNLLESWRFNISKDILPEMAKIGGGTPIARRKGDLMKCTQTIHPTIMMNGMKKKDE